MAWNGKRLRKVRLAHELTQVKLAAKLKGVSGKMISDYERNVETPNANVLYQFCLALGIPSDYFLELIDYVDIGPLSGDELEMIRRRRRGNRNARNVTINSLIDNNLD